MWLMTQSIPSSSDDLQSLLYQRLHEDVGGSSSELNDSNANDSNANDTTLTVSSWSTNSLIEAETSEIKILDLTDSSVQRQNKLICGIRRSSLLFFFYIPFYIAFLVGGAFLFSLIEGPNEMQHIDELKEERKNFLKTHSCVSGK